MFLVISSLETVLLGSGGAAQAIQGDFLPGPDSAMVRGDLCPPEPLEAQLGEDDFTAVLHMVGQLP